MTPAPNDPLPADVAERIHVYFAAFLSPLAADEAMAELEADVRRSGATRPEVLRLAHEQLAARVDVPLAIELAVLLEDLGVPVATAAHAVGAPPETVARIAAEHGLTTRVGQPWTDLAADGTDVDQDDDPPRGRRRDRAPGMPRTTRQGIVVVLGVLVAAVVAVVLLARPPGTGACEPTVDQPVCVVETRLTHVVDASGNPGAPRSSFEAGEPVRLWFSYEVLDPQRRYTVDYAWFHEDRGLYTTSFVLPPVGRVNLTLAQAVVDQPGDYRIEVRLGDDVLVDRRFRIAA